MAIMDWLQKHNADQKMLKWASESCKTLQDFWDNAPEDWLIWMTKQPGILTDKELRQITQYELVSVWGMVPSEKNEAVIKAANQYVENEITKEYLDNAVAEAVKDARTQCTRYQTEIITAMSRSEYWTALYIRKNCRPNFSEDRDTIIENAFKGMNRTEAVKSFINWLIMNKIVDASQEELLDKYIDHSITGNQ